MSAIERHKKWSHWAMDRGFDIRLNDRVYPNSMEIERYRRRQHSNQWVFDESAVLDERDEVPKRLNAKFFQRASRGEPQVFASYVTFALICGVGPEKFVAVETMALTEQIASADDDHVKSEEPMSDDETSSPLEYVYVAADLRSDIRRWISTTLAVACLTTLLYMLMIALQLNTHIAFPLLSSASACFAAYLCWRTTRLIMPAEVQIYIGFVFALLCGMLAYFSLSIVDPAHQEFFSREYVWLAGFFSIAGACAAFSAAYNVFHYRSTEEAVADVIRGQALAGGIAVICVGLSIWLSLRAESL
ncbi:MAG: hypothetical protein AAGM38_12560 [Pseudomonadota bacterium]